ncbi:Ankyrin-3 [Eumeta japonica]|uniref:Ankyrin-3 n=1 Tax=Eumeta variegata TaxID=151549 RepID=A0A4C1VSL8_EUMVA|nr:Ankyrin-3 [Eumeta japonica]
MQNSVNTNSNIAASINKLNSNSREIIAFGLLLITSGLTITANVRKCNRQAQIIDSELTAKLLGRGVAVSPVVTVEPRRRKFHKAITLSMPAPRPHTQGMTNQYSTSSAPTLRLLCSISGGTNRAHWEDVTENTPLTFVNDCVSFTTTVSARYWLIDCRHVEDATKMATELYREAIHVPFMARFVVYAKRTDQQQAQLRMFCVTDDKEDKALERIEKYAQVAKSRDVEVHEGKPCYLEFAGNLVPVTKSGEQLSVPFKAFRENRLAFSVMVKSVHADAVARCQFMREPKVPKGEPTPAPICVLNIVIPEEMVEVTVERTTTPVMTTHAEDQDLVWRQRLSDPRLEDICNLLGKDWVALAYELGVSVATVNQIQAKRITAPEQAQLMLKLWKTQSGVKTQDNSLELALCRIGRDDIIAPQSDVANERRIQRNIYQERQASEEIEAYKAEEDNKLKEKLYEDNKMAESIPNETELQDHDEAKYSPEEKSLPEKTEQDRTPTPSEESDDEDVKRSVAERKEQITRKLSSSKIPASKQKKEIREEIIEIKTQIKPDIKKFHDIEQQVKEKEQGKLERSRSKSSPESADDERDIEQKLDESQIIEKTTEVLRKYDPSSPTKPTPKHLQRHIRTESMRFPSGDFSNVTITPRKSIPTEVTDSKPSEKIIESTLVKEAISQKEIVSSRVEEKLEDGEKSPELIMDDTKDIAEATLKDKISSFESRISKEPSLDFPKSTIKLTKEALMKHTQDHDQGLEYTQEFVREQSKQISSIQTVEIKKTLMNETEKKTEVIKSVKETIQHFDTKMKHEDKVPKTFPKTTRTDSTLVQVSSEEDSEFLKKSTDSETETESQTTVKVEKDALTRKDVEINLIKDRDAEDEIWKKQMKVDTVKLTTLITEKDKALEETRHEGMIVADKVIEKVDKVTTPGVTTESITTKVEVMTTGEPPSSAIIDKVDSLADLQQSTEKDLSYISQSDSKVYSEDSKHRSDSIDETSQFSDLEDQTGVSPAHRHATESKEVTDDIVPIRASDAAARDRTLEFLQYESEYSARIHSPVHMIYEVEKVSPKESPVISAKARQFIETVPEDDSVQECFFSKRIYSDSLEDSEHTDSRRHSEAESLKSDQSDVKAKVSSSDFDERAEYEETIDSGSGFGDEKFEESVGFTSLKLDMATVEVEKADSDKSEDQVEVIFQKMTPKRHSRTESISILKLDEIQPEIEEQKAKQEFQMFVTEAEEIITSFEKDEPSDKISSESSREIEMSDRKSSEGISDKISSEDGVTEKKTSSEEDAVKEEHTPTDREKDIKITAFLEKSVKEIEKTEKRIQILKDEIADKTGDVVKRQSVTSAGSISELRLDEKRLSDAHSLTESRDYTFEESEDDIGTQGDGAREKVDTKIDLEHKSKISTGKIADTSKHRLTHGDSLDDVEGFPEDHVTDHVHKLPNIAEVG